MTAMFYDCCSPPIKRSLALLEPLLSEGSLSHLFALCILHPLSPPHIHTHTYTHNSYVITLFADATIIPFTVSADATITS